MSPEQSPEEIPVDPMVTSELYLRWRSPVSGKSNPERMDNPVWCWLVQNGISAYHANERMGGPSPLEAGPGWCFNRNGQSVNALADGRTVFISGEHEDYYDPDFFIYNDVVIRHPDGRIEILGYPKEVFPPTDFHAATLVQNRILLIGNLGYPQQRQPGRTQVLQLDLETFAISQMETTGEPPGWIHKHSAELVDEGQAIIIRNGLMDRGRESEVLVENIDDWKFHLSDSRWERLSRRNWPRFQFRREDGQPDHLLDIWLAEINRRLGLPEFAASPELKDLLELPSLEEQLRGPVDWDLYKRRYRPDIDCEILPENSEETGVFRICIQGVIIRYVEQFRGVQLTVEGELPPETVATLAEDLRVKLSALERSPWIVKPL